MTIQNKARIESRKKKAQWITDTHHWLTEHSGEGEKNVNKFRWTKQHTKKSKLTIPFGLRWRFVLLWAENVTNDTQNSN